MNTPDENKQQAIHEERLLNDPEYALEHKKEEIFDDLKNFIQFSDDYQMMHEIGRELLRAITNIEVANKYIHIQGSGSAEELRMRESVNLAILTSRNAVIDAVTRIKDSFDAKISYDVEKES